jgi:adenylate kinase
MANTKKQVVILFGPPGAGKGTQSNLLSEKLGLYLFETSNILEKKFKEADDSSKRFFEFDGQKFDVFDEKKKWEEGILCSPPFVTLLVMERIKELFQDGKSLVLSGSPRTLYEAEKILPVLKELYGEKGIKVVLIEINPEETIFRNSHRKICELMRHSILYNKETEDLTLCPLDGSKLIKREGLDDPETIKVRLKEYKERTFPIFDYFQKHGIDIKKVNGEQSVSDVFEDVMKALE